MEQEILNTQAQKEDDIQKEDKRCEIQKDNIQQEDKKCEVDEEEQEIVNIQAQKEYNIQQEDYRFEVDEEEQVNRKAQEQKEDNIQQEDNSCKVDEEEQEIIPPYFQPFFWEDNSWYKLVRFEDYYRLPHIEDRIEKEKCWYGIKPPLGYIEHVRRERKKDKEIWLENLKSKGHILQQIQETKEQILKSRNEVMKHVTSETLKQNERIGKITTDDTSYMERSVFR